MICVMWQLGGNKRFVIIWIYNVPKLSVRPSYFNVSRLKINEHTDQLLLDNITNFCLSTLY